MKPPLLFLCHRVPYPPNKGDKIRSFHLLHHLSEHFDIFLGTFVDDPGDRPWIAEVEKYCVECKCLDLNPRAARVRSLSGMIRGEVLSLPYYRSAEMRRWVDRCVKRHAIRHVLVYSAAMAQYVLDAGTDFTTRIIDFVDIDSDKWRQYARQKPWPMNWIYRREGELLLAFEREVASEFDAGLFVSYHEADLFRQLAPESAAKIGYFNNGVNLDYFTPGQLAGSPYRDGSRVLVFTGAMDYWPNIDAVVHFARQVFPALRRSYPELEFFVVGSNPARAVRSLSQSPGVTITGRVEDIRPYIEHAFAAVAPMRIARGVQNKVLEAMAMEVPVLVSGRGLEGIQAEDRKHVLLAESPDDYRRLLADLLAGHYRGMGQRARALISEDFDWDKNLPEVTMLLSGEKTWSEAGAAQLG